MCKPKFQVYFFEKWELVYFDSQRGRRLALCVYTDRLPLVRRWSFVKVKENQKGGETES